MGQTVNRIAFDASTAAAAEQTINMSLNGAASAATVAIAAGSALEIGDMTFNSRASGGTIFKIEFTTDGVAFSDVANYMLASATRNLTQDFTTGMRIDGGANVAIRLRAETILGAARVLGHLSATNTSGA